MTDEDILHRAAAATLPETCRTAAITPRPRSSAPALASGFAPCIVDAGTRAAYVGPSFTLGRHRNAVAVLAVGLEAEFDFGTREDRRDARPLRHALIPPGRWHWLDARGGAMGFLYLDACDVAWRTVDAAGHLNDDALVAAFRRLLSEPAPLSEAWSALVESLALPAPMPTDAGVAEAMARVRRDPARRHDAASHAARSGCALSTFQRRFTAQAGLPWRRWRQWQRLRHAARAICEGVDLTTAAHAAGFASGSHFSDVFRATFGLAPSRFVDWGVGWRMIGA